MSLIKSAKSQETVGEQSGIKDDVNISSKQQITLSIMNGECFVKATAIDVNENDWMTLYADGTAQTCLKGRPVSQGPFVFNVLAQSGMVAKYESYNGHTLTIAATTQPLPNAKKSIFFTYYTRESWISLGYNQGFFVVSWNIPMKKDANWIGIYTSESEPNDRAIVKYMMNDVLSPQLTIITIKTGYQIRFFYDDIKIAETEQFEDIKTYSDQEGYPRKPSNAEFSSLFSAFPKLVRANVTLTDGQTLDKRYNCIAWSLGFNDRWISPKSPPADFIKQYEGYGCIECAKDGDGAIIDAWAAGNEGKHGSKKYNGTLWESKLGQSFRITHGREELADEPSHKPLYGNIFQSFKELLLPAGVFMTRAECIVSKSEHDIITKLAISMPDEIKKQFETFYITWKYAISDHDFMFCSDTNEYRQASGYKELLAMGVEIIPLIMEKLLDENNFMLLVLYDDLQVVDDLLIQYSKDEDLTILLEGEQTRAKRTIKKWLLSTL